MSIYLQNTLSGKKEEFDPIKKGNLSMYNCGPTVYSRAHIGNMRAYIFADTIRRVFEYNDYKVNQIINITDVGHLVSDSDEGDDKIEKSAKEQNRTAEDITKEYTNLFFEDLNSLNIERREIIFPKATEHIKEQIEMIQNLEKKGFTYKTSDGIYFDTSKFKDYGKLGNINIKNLQEGARVEKNEEKKNHTDFALWKFSKPEEKRQQEWTSPWGTGFPGWHIECSAMSKKYLGETFDIHTGGIDHIPTHHNNEIAQSESATEKKQANYWLHVNHVMLNGEKISKSTSNVAFLDNLEEKNISPLAYRYWILTADYKTLINFTWQSVEASKKAFEKLINNLSNFPDNGEINNEYKEKFLNSINDDLNTASGIAILWELLKDNLVLPADKKATIFDFDRVLGLNLEAISRFAKEIKADIPEEILKLVEERENARSEKNFKKADEIRDLIKEKGYEVKDGEGGGEITKLN